MLKHLSQFLSLVFLISCVTAVNAQKSTSGLISENTAQRHGLSRVWFTNVELDLASDRIANLTLHSSFAEKKTFLVYDVIEEKSGRRHIFSQKDKGQFGDVIGPEIAKQKAYAKQTELNNKKIISKVEKRIIPHSILVAQTARGVIHAVDAENGRTLWARSIGKRIYPTTSVAVNDKYVAGINGTRLYMLDRTTGKILWEKKLGNAPGAGPALTKEMVYIPMANGKVEAYYLKDSSKSPWIYASSGRAFVRMTATVKSVVWPTDRGHVYVAHANIGRIKYRIETRDVVVSPPAFGNNLIIVASNDGNVYANHEMSGRNIWRYSSGLPISEQPAAIGNKVYVFPERSGVVCLDLKTGKKLWATPRAKSFLAASRTRLYMRDNVGRTLILNAKTGGVIDRFDTSKLDINLVNQKTDRIYIGNKRGMIQCLREISQRDPVTYRPSIKAKEEGPKIIQEGLEKEEDSLEDDELKDE